MFEALERETKLFRILVISFAASSREAMAINLSLDLK